MSFIEHRRAARFALKVPVIIRWRDGANMREARTISQDVSSNGLYFFLPAGIADGTNVEVEMTLATEITRGEPVRVRCLGRIMRCEQEEGAHVGVAAAIRKYEFLSRNDDAHADTKADLVSKS